MIVENIEKVDSNYIALHTDVYCYKCKRLMALSYCIEYDGRYYCQLCTEKLNIRKPVKKEK